MVPRLALLPRSKTVPGSDLSETRGSHLMIYFGDMFSYETDNVEVSSLSIKILKRKKNTDLQFSFMY